MPRRKIKPGAGFDAEHDNDSLSVSSDGTLSLAASGDVEVDETMSFARDLDEAIEELFEKRGTTRVAAFQKLIKLLTSQVAEEVVQQRADTMVERIESSVRHGSDEEVGLAYALVSILALCCGVNVMGAPLVDLASTSAASSRVNASRRVGALDMLAVRAVLSQEEELWEGLGTLSAGVLHRVHHVPAPVLIAALRAWGVAAAFTSPVAPRKYARILQVLLCHPNIRVRIGAGENLAMLVGTWEEKDDDDDDEADSDEDDLNEDDWEQDDVANGSGVERGSDDDDEQDELLPRANDLQLIDPWDRQDRVMFKVTSLLNMLAKESSRRTAKRTLRTQRSVFRELCDAVESGVPPEETITFGMESLEIRTWRDRNTLALLRHLLGSGLPEHLTTNENIRDLFELGPIVQTPTLQDMKQDKAGARRMHAEHAKLRAQRRSQQRAGTVRAARWED